MGTGNCFCTTDDSTDYPKWSTWDAISWKIWPQRWGGGGPRLFSYKDGWVTHNKVVIKQEAANNQIPAELLAGVAWEEAGGMPDWVDGAAYPVRKFDWSGPEWIDKHLTITKNPDLTSFGSVSIQLSNVASILGLDIHTLSDQQKQDLIHCLEHDAYNLKIVAKHLYKLIRYDFPDADTLHLSELQFVVVGSRYNRGTARKLQDFVDSFNAQPGAKNRDVTSYGRTMWRRRERIQVLLAQ